MDKYLKWTGELKSYNKREDKKIFKLTVEQRLVFPDLKAQLDEEAIPEKKKVGRPALSNAAKRVKEEAYDKVHRERLRQLEFQRLQARTQALRTKAQQDLE